MEKRGYLRFIYNQNPFYLISACFVLYGIQSTLSNSTEPGSLWLLASILAGYSLLMAVTAIVIVKLGKVWDDARSILMVLLLMFFSISVSFDELCITNPKLATLMLLSGFAFCSSTSEFVIRTLRIKFPARFRIPYHLILLTIFCYPLLFTAKQLWYPTIHSHWLMLAFPVFAALSLLTLIPAIRLGQEHLKENGTPWKWPLFPWSVFGMLTIGICLRTAVFCISFEPSVGLSSAYGSYFLIPVDKPKPELHQTLSAAQDI